MDPTTKSIPTFRYESLLTMVLWSLVTLSLYIPWWFYRQTQVVNGHAGRVIVPTPLIHVAVVSYIVFVGLVISLLVSMTPGMTEPPQPPPIMSVVNIVASTCVMIWTLLLRVGVNLLSRATPNDATWVGLPGTIIAAIIGVSPWYLQFKINQILLDKQKSA